MAKNVTQKLIESHLIDGDMKPGKEIGLKIDQALLQDATGTLVQLELEAMGLDRAKTEVAVQYVDHNLLQTDCLRFSSYPTFQNIRAKSTKVFLCL